MTVKELILELSKCPEDTPVIVQDGDTIMPIWGASYMTFDDCTPPEDPAMLLMFD